MNKFVEQFLLGIIDDLYDLGYSMTKEEVDKLHDDLIVLVLKELQR